MTGETRAQLKEAVNAVARRDVRIQELVETVDRLYAGLERAEKRISKERQKYECAAQRGERQRRKIKRLETRLADSRRRRSYWQHLAYCRRLHLDQAALRLAALKRQHKWEVRELTTA